MTHGSTFIAGGSSAVRYYAASIASRIPSITSGTALALSALLFVACIAACTSQPPPGGSGAPCTYLREDVTMSAEADGGTGKLLFSPDAGLVCAQGAECAFRCWPPTGFQPDGGALACILLVTVPGSSDESSCATYGYDVPEATVLRQTQAEDDASPPSAVCLVPQVYPSLLDAGGDCVMASTPAWCIAGGPAVSAVTACNQVMVLSNPTLRAGFRYSLWCLQGC